VKINIKQSTTSWKSCSKIWFYKYLSLATNFFEDQIMTQLDINLTNLENVFREIGLYSSANQCYKARIRKHQQILAYIQQIQPILNRLSRKRPIVLLDCACGKSYLSFALYAYCQTILQRQIKIIGVDNNTDLINKCTASAAKLGFTNMCFYSSNLDSFKLDEKIDIAYSLHACDTATDQTIGLGINLGAHYILSVSCCQHTNRLSIGKHSLTSVSRFRPYKERLVDMIGDSMRALLLESKGYAVDIFEFVASEQTPKNIMLRATKNAANKKAKEQAMIQYDYLVETFNFAPKLENLIC
jgi:hypothetical protein